MSDLCILCLKQPQRAFEVCLVCLHEHWGECRRLQTQLSSARKANKPATLTLGQWLRILKQHNFHCAYCAERGETGPYEVLEHYIPLSRGGGTTQENCRPACRSCNSKKQDKYPEQA